tara:strand:+ start:163 stop:393 length:231 start_codon:yes stop_codon:yes gene_type:complete
MKKYFEYQNKAINSYKFWEINWKEKKVTITYGRIGIDNPASKEVKPNGKPFKSKEEAKAYVEEKIREKTNKGYIEK